MTRNETLLLKRVLREIDDRIELDRGYGPGEYMLGRSDGLSMASFIVRRIMDEAS